MVSETDRHSLVKTHAYVSPMNTHTDTDTQVSAFKIWREEVSPTPITRVRLIQRSKKELGFGMIIIREH